ncbi:MAG: uroporphyrinogen decarboxylase family protein [Thermodesulfobacteriota bacterium]|nr:uroporphyrinogen decarboxylase family protein [Thermodesulfobacteriota bacterium]
MTKKERIETMLAGKPVDQVPLFPFLLGFCAKNMGYPISTIYNNAEKSFHAQLKTMEQYRFDWGPIYGYASYGTWEFGGEIEMPSGEYQQAPSHKMFPVKSEEDVEGLRLPDVRKAGCIPLAMEFSRLQDKFDLPVSLVLGGNFTIAGNICAVEKLCRWMLKKPEIAHKVLKMATDHILDTVAYWAQTFGPERVIPQLWEPLAANLIISPKQFEEFVLPYLIESSEKILAMGVRHILYHICGEQNDNLNAWAKVPTGDPGLCSFGEEIDIARAIEVLGEKNIIIGNIDPRILLTGNPQEIYDLCRESIEKGHKAPRGFMLSSGCEVSPETPGYHIYMMQKAVQDFGTYNG